MIFLFFYNRQQAIELFVLRFTPWCLPVTVCLGQKKICSVSEERNKKAQGLNNKGAELLVCPGGRGRYRGILSLKKPLQSANGVTKDSVGKALLLGINRELVLETCAIATRQAGPKHNILCILAWSSFSLLLLLACFLSFLLSSFHLFPQHLTTSPPFSPTMNSQSDVMLLLRPGKRLLLAYNPVVGSGTEQKTT